MEPDEIWQTIVKADEALKYATAEKADRRRQQAIERLQAANQQGLAALKLILVLPVQQEDQYSNNYAGTRRDDCRGHILPSQ